MYDEDLVTPMRRQLTDIGFSELRTAEDVDAALSDKTGTAMVVLNSVCGCAAGGARPGIKMAIESGIRTDQLLTIFAGQDKFAVDKARNSYFIGYPPSSPCIAFFKDGEIQSMIERRDIEGHRPEDIMEQIKAHIEEL